MKSQLLQASSTISSHYYEYQPLHSILVLQPLPAMAHLRLHISAPWVTGHLAARLLLLHKMLVLDDSGYF